MIQSPNHDGSQCKRLIFSGGSAVKIFYRKKEDYEAVEKDPVSQLHSVTFKLQSLIQVTKQMDTDLSLFENNQGVSFILFSK